MKNVDPMALSLFNEIAATTVGTDAVLDSTQAELRYGASTIDIEKRIAGAVQVSSSEQVVTLVKASREHRVPIYPVSTGKNWGYGSSLPAVDNCVVLDLSGMKRILSVDQQSGIAIVEPGVTQQALREYLDAHSLNFLCPVTGAGPTCSIVGNALERGYGITPHADHFLSIMSLKAVLPDGSLYEPPLAAAGCEQVDQLFKWGVGPFMDGLFTQSAFGIVTQMSIALAPRPDVVNGFFFAVKQDSDLEEVVSAVSETLADAGGVLGSINLMNSRRVISMMESYPGEHLNADGIVDADYLESTAKRHQVMPWMGAGALYGNADIAAAARKTVKRRLSGKVKRLLFFSPQSVARYHRLSHFLPFEFGRGIENLFGTLTKTLSILSGAPSTVALPLAYWKGGELPPDGQAFNPAADGCGLIWYSPLVPMDPSVVRAFIDMVHRVCSEHSVEPLITMTSLSERCFDSTVPLLFNPKEPGATDRTHACYRALLLAGRELGCTPYRAPISDMQSFVNPQAPYWKMVDMIKTGLDPDGLLSPGRYSLEP
ncbi:MAG: FAD-binding oxidoreductase [Congregibacter sp.]